ncbi:hypothetical protein, partial [Vibrio anguillarum]|uniref:hypothetical protein n=1 Tax=Vibrio anguillarum TaxID=55601 RepID=UPI001BE4C77A
TQRLFLRVYLSGIYLLNIGRLPNTHQQSANTFRKYFEDLRSENKKHRAKQTEPCPHKIKPERLCDSDKRT